MDFTFSAGGSTGAANDLLRQILTFAGKEGLSYNRAGFNFIILMLGSGFQKTDDPEDRARFTPILIEATTVLDKDEND
ncbi:hypothetical protein [Erwinia sp. JUb26]|uniref:hypothetical protein n=1 Tax=Erwinia sp. JUb26 TaxID=2485126 RepID=UPI000F4AB811|nr:hypothetical protein [Erwinia sp. JUb26]ROR05573.1 hypothetical protein EC836_10936 [Erwinia sp. JUb26]